MARLIERRALLLAQPKVDRAKVLLQLLFIARAGDDVHDARPCAQLGDGDLGDGAPDLLHGLIEDVIVRVEYDASRELVPSRSFTGSPSLEREAADARFRAGSHNVRYPHPPHLRYHSWAHPLRPL